ncbi:hypothetical protein [uncultured Sphingomonas sp.]
MFGRTIRVPVTTISLLSVFLSSSGAWAPDIVDVPWSVDVLAIVSFCSLF